MADQGISRKRSLSPSTVLMMTKRTSSLLMPFVLTLLLPLGCGGMEFAGMGDNCILSFVVPRDKVKSSCDVDERVIRRLNSMETRVSLSQQHVERLEQMLSRERQEHTQTVLELTQRMTRLASHDLNPLNTESAVVKRLNAMEDEVRRLRAGFISSTSPFFTASGRGGFGGDSGGFGADRGGFGTDRGGSGADRGGGTDDERRRKEEEDKAMANLVKSIVHTEVKKLFDNYTHYVGRYVRDQAIAFNQIINMVPRNDQSMPPRWGTSSSSTSGTRWPTGSNEVEVPSSTPPPLDEGLVMVKELEDIRNRMNTTGRRLVQHMHTVLQHVNKVTATTAAKASTAASSAAPSAPSSSMTTKAEMKSTTKLDEFTLAPPSSPSAVDSSPEHYTTVSGDNGTVSDNDTNVNGTFTTTAATKTTDIRDNDDLPVTAKVETAPSITIHDKDNTVAAVAAAATSSGSGAKSRMSHNNNNDNDKDTVDKTVNVGKEGSAEGGDSKVNNRSSWEENMVDDESTGEWVQLLLRTELQKVLQQQVEEVLSLVNKHSNLVDTKLHDTDRRFSQLEQRITTDIKNLDQTVNGLKQEITTVSQELQGLKGQWDKVEEMENTVEELKKNLTALEVNPNFNPRPMIDEQDKKIRKMERLTDIYSKSLDHIRNETKLEYRDLADRLSKESSVLRAIHNDLYANITEYSRQLTMQVNNSASKQGENLRQRLAVIEDNTLLLQIDLSRIERDMKSKSSHSDKLQTDVQELQQKTRNMQKTLNSAVNVQDQLTTSVNSTSSEMQMLQMEFKLLASDVWLPYTFDYMKTRTDCFGEQYIRKSGFSNGRIVGAVLCSQDRYKLFLGQSLTDTFKNIGDDTGMGEDHCQFVGAKSLSKVKVSEPVRTSEIEPGYVRAQWGQDPKLDLLNIFRPSPVWYECGVTIP